MPLTLAKESDSVGQALSGVVGLGLIGLLIAMFVQLIGGFFAPGVFGGSGLELIIAGFGTVLFSLQCHLSISIQCQEDIMMINILQGL